MREHQLDAIRGWAALAVAFGHCATATSPQPLYNKTIWQVDWASPTDAAFRLLHLIFHADAAVLVFFVLSGHVLFQSLQRSNTTLLDLPSYAVRRLFRIMPLVIVCLLPLAFLLSLPWDVLAGNMMVLNTKANGVTWSLQVELVGSLVVFAAAVLAPRHSWLMICGMLVVVFVLVHLLPPWNHVMFMPLFLFGCACGALQRFAKATPTLFWIGVGLVLLPDLLIGKGYASIYTSGVGAVLMICSAHRTRGWFLDSWVADFLGRMSYPFYLLHLIGVIFARMILARAGIAAEGLHGFILLAGLSIPIAYALAYVAHVAVELPGIEAGKIVGRSLRSLLLARYARYRRPAIPRWRN